MNEKLRIALEMQVGLELYSSNLYRQFAHNASLAGLTRMSEWFQKAAIEESEHATRILKFLSDRDLPVEIGQIEPCPRILDILGMVNATVAHERSITDSLHSIHDKSEELKEPLVCVFTLGMLGEQIKEESKALTLQKYARISSNFAELEALL